MRRYVPALAALLLLAAACGSAGDDDAGRVDGGGSAGTAASTGTEGSEANGGAGNGPGLGSSNGATTLAAGRFGAGEAFSVTSALAEIPVTYDDDGLLVTLGDLVAASEAAGVERPTSAGDGSTVGDWALQVTGARTENGTVFVPVAEALGLANLAAVGAFDDELGWSIVDVEAFVEASAKPAFMAVVTGEGLGPDVLTDARVAPLGDGLYTAGEGEDFQTDLTERSPARPLGSPLRIAVDDGRLAVSSVTASVQRWQAGDSETLAGIEPYHQLAAALDGAEPYAAAISRRTGGTGARAAAGTSDPSVRLTAPYGLVGIGWSMEDGEAVITIAHHFGDDATAEAQVGQLRSVFEQGNSVQGGTPLSERFALRSVEASGPVTVTTLGLAGNGTAMHAFNMLVAQDLPFAAPR